MRGDLNEFYDRHYAYRGPPKNKTYSSHQQALNQIKIYVIFIVIADALALKTREGRRVTRLN